MSHDCKMNCKQNTANTSSSTITNKSVTPCTPMHDSVIFEGSMHQCPSFVKIQLVLSEISCFTCGWRNRWQRKNKEKIIVGREQARGECKMRITVKFISRVVWTTIITEVFWFTQHNTFQLSLCINQVLNSWLLTLDVHHYHIEFYAEMCAEQAVALKFSAQLGSIVLKVTKS